MFLPEFTLHYILIILTSVISYLGSSLAPFVCGYHDDIVLDFCDACSLDFSSKVHKQLL